MLVLSRGQNDKVLFPNLGITVQVLRVSGRQVRLGIDAPTDVRVLRHEVHQESTEHSAQHNLRGKATKSRNARRIQHGLDLAASSLNELYQLCGRDLKPESERLVFDIFRHLKSIDDHVDHDISKPSRHSGGKRALLVEDNENESRLLGSYLRNQHFHVDIAADGVAALDFLRKQKMPDVMLLDMQMPRLDGGEVVRAIRDQDRFDDLKVYAISGAEPDDYGVEVGPNGVHGWFPKPLDPEALVFRLSFEEADFSTPAWGQEGAETPVESLTGSR